MLPDNVIIKYIDDGFTSELPWTSKLFEERDFFSITVYVAQMLSVSHPELPLSEFKHISDVVFRYLYPYPDIDEAFSELDEKHPGTD